MMLHRLSTIRSGTRSPGAEKRKRNSQKRRRILSSSSPFSSSPLSSSFLHLLPSISSIGLVVVGSMMLGCIGSENLGSMVYAEGTSSEIMPTALDQTVALSLIDEETNLSTNATTKEVAYITKDFKVTAGGEYHIYVQSSTGTSDLVSGASRIPTTSKHNIAPESLEDNTWGYAVAEGTPDSNTMQYNTIPTTTTNAIQSGNGADNTTYRLAFAAKFGSDASAGHYRSNIVLSVAATPEEVADSWTIHNMQDMNATICMNAKEGTTGQLVDLRDGKTYWVTKLKDGNCWMVQNLDYDGGGIRRKEISEWANDYSVAQYYDPGNYYRDDAENWEACAQVDSLNDPACVKAGWTTEGDDHYHVGNYYSFAVGSTSASNDICPTGWQLPIGNADSMNGSYAKLLESYDISNTPADALRVRKAPLYFMTSGIIGGDMVLSGVGGQGNYWTSSTGTTSSSGWYFRFSRSEVRIGGDGTRVGGRSVRCVLQAEDKKSIETSTYMDEITPLVCKNSGLEVQKQLIDRRDGKKYWVAQLKDGACWMTQNLDYDITTEDIPNIKRYDWTTGLSPEGNKWPANTLEGSDGIPRYYDPGYYYKTDTTDWTYNNACNNQSEGLANAACKDSGFTTAGDSHFAVGNYYNWYAATKGSGTNSTTGEASDSICPAGWRLPESNIDKSGSFGTTLPGNGDQSGDDYSLAGVYKWTDNNNVNTGAPSLRVAPLYFVPSGIVRSGVLINAGYLADYWSSTALSTAGYAYYLTFDSTRVYPAGNYFVSDGYSVRCIVR